MKLRNVAIVGFAQAPTSAGDPHPLVAVGHDVRERGVGAVEPDEDEGERGVGRMEPG